MGVLDWGKRDRSCFLVLLFAFLDAGGGSTEKRFESLIGR
jgi:hypothetical protein